MPIFNSSNINISDTSTTIALGRDIIISNLKFSRGDLKAFLKGRVIKVPFNKNEIKRIYMNGLLLIEGKDYIFNDKCILLHPTNVPQKDATLSIDVLTHYNI